MYVAKFGAPGPNTKIFVRAKNVVNGQAGVASAWRGHRPCGLAAREGGALEPRPLPGQRSATPPCRPRSTAVALP